MSTHNGNSHYGLIDLVIAAFNNILDTLVNYHISQITSRSEFLRMQDLFYQKSPARSCSSI